VPVEILPDTMQKVAMISPLHWSLEGVNEVVLRNKDLLGVVKPFCILVGSGILLSILPVFFGKK
jgi:ABC-type multidrug transport system permease subunit